MKNARGQFYIIASVFVMISLSALFLFAVFVDFGSLTLPTQSADFENLKNAVGQQNSWLPSYWQELHWRNRAVVDITGGITNPVQIDPGIANGYDCYNHVVVFNKSSAGYYTYVPSNVSSSTAPCNVIFGATTGVYEIYWNCTGSLNCNNPRSGRGTLPSAGTAPTYTKYPEAAPSDVCNHFAGLLARKNIAFNCSARLPGGEIYTYIYNYSVGFRATDFAYNGSLT